MEEGQERLEALGGDRLAKLVGEDVDGLGRRVLAPAPGRLLNLE